MPVTVTLRSASGATTTRTLPDPVVTTTTPAKPAPPTGLKVVSSTDTTVTLDWADSPDLIAGDKYQVYVNDVWAGLESTASNYVITGLTKASVYQFRVGAGQVVRYGNWSAAVSGTTTGTVIPPPAGTVTNRPTNPCLIAFHDTAVMSAANVAAWAKPGAMIIAGRNNYALPWVKQVAAGGCSVLVYLHPNMMNTVGRYPDKLYNASEFGAKVPDWPGGPWRIDEYGFLGDARPGSLLNQKLPGVLNLIISENPHVSGFFLDGLGTNAVPGAGGFNWGSFPDKQLYRAGAIEQCKIVRGICDEKNLIAIVNGNWDATQGGGYPDSSKHGCSLVDGGMIENHPPEGPSGWGNQYSNAATAQWGIEVPRLKNLPAPHGFQVYTNVNKSEMDGWVGYSVAAWATYGDYSTVNGPWRNTFTDFKVPNRKV